ncbi:IclR family transcriptional regulator [Rathayibacter soli]|uniref:IclR family transcriptional regulator n=1 Tax=Rathayibacter soli TaxID=3144168 RepID=UPI0027E49EE3|nr:IclR family transcriptional regulator [Glaciibacter superstes]
MARAATLLKAMAARGKPMGLSDLARSIEISKPATFHLLRTLELEGFVVKGPDATYQLDWGLYELGSAVIRSVDLTRVTRIHLDRLAEETGEAVLLSILDGESVLYLDRGQSTESFTMVANVGRRSPLHTNASGKVLLAHQDQRFIATVLGKPLEANTPATVCNPRELEVQLLDVRRDGYATCWQEQELGLCSIAVPIFDYTGKACAAMAIAGPAERVTKLSVPGFVQRLQDEAHQISSKLGALEPALSTRSAG